jgi:hypothetical protein
MQDRAGGRAQVVLYAPDHDVDAIEQHLTRDQAPFLGTGVRSPATVRLDRSARIATRRCWNRDRGPESHSAYPRGAALRAVRRP